MVMTPTELLENLCAYDTRSPYYDPESAEGRTPGVDCSCDACHRGTDLLVREILDRKKSTTKKMWVLQLESYTGEPYYAKAPFCGGTTVLAQAHRHEIAPESLVGVAVEVEVTTSVELV
jgi:hypothetical protein